MARTLTDNINMLTREMRAIASQNLATDPADLRAEAGADVSIQVPSTADHLIVVTFTPADSRGAGTMMMGWLSRIGVPQNDYGITEDWVGMVQDGPSSWRIQTPLVAVNSTIPWTIGVHISSLVAGSASIQDMGAITI